MNDEFMEGIAAYEEEVRWKTIKFVTPPKDCLYCAWLEYEYYKVRFPEKAEPFKAAMLKGESYTINPLWVMTPVLMPYPPEVGTMIPLVGN